MNDSYRSFADFYPFYLSEHKDPTCRRLHFAGSALVLACLAGGILTGDGGWFIAAPFAGYGFAWIGHIFFEHNRPATFRHPIYSFIGDWAMFRDVLIGKIRL